MGSFDEILPDLRFFSEIIFFNIPPLHMMKEGTETCPPALNVVA
jgi:hypothetical protein